MRIMRYAPLAILPAVAACSSPVATVVDISVRPGVPSTAKVRQLAGKAASPTGSGCKTPCSLTLDEDSEFEVGIDAPGYYPAVVKVNGKTALNQNNIGHPNEAGPGRVPLVIPLVPKAMHQNRVAQ